VLCFHWTKYYGFVFFYFITQVIGSYGLFTLTVYILFCILTRAVSMNALSGGEIYLSLYRIIGMAFSRAVFGHGILSAQLFTLNPDQSFNSCVC